MTATFFVVALFCGWCVGLLVGLGVGVSQLAIKRKEPEPKETKP